MLVGDELVAPPGKPRRRQSRYEQLRIGRAPSAPREARLASQPCNGALIRFNLKTMGHGRPALLSADSGFAAAALKGISRSRRERLLVRRDEPVASAGLGEQIARARRVGLELAPQLRDVDVQVVRLVPVGRPPHLAQDRPMRQQLALVLGEQRAGGGTRAASGGRARRSTLTACLLEVDRDRARRRAPARPGCPPVAAPRAGAPSSSPIANGFVT